MQGYRSHHAMRFWASAACLGLGCVSLAGCATKPTPPMADTSATNAGLNALAAGDSAAAETREPAAGANYKPGTRLSETELQKLAEESAIDLNKVLAERNQRRGDAGQADTRRAPSQSKPAETTIAAGGAASEPSTTSAPAESEPTPPAPEATKQAAPTPEAPVEEDPQAKMQRLANELSALIQKRMVASPDPVPDVLALAAIDALKPGGSAALPEGVDKSLSPPELKAVNAVRDLIRGLVGDPATARDPAKAADRVMDVLKQLAQSKPLAIARAALCSKVNGFGQYTPLGGSAFLAGGTSKAIIYTEIDGFSHRDEVNSGEPMYAVELSQEAALFHAGDNTLQWRWPEQQIREVSRNKRRDFFVIRQIDLPRNLTVGQYVLKVTIRDKVDAKAVAQTSLPITIVADPTLVTAK